MNCDNYFHKLFVHNVCDTILEDYGLNSVIFGRSEILEFIERNKINDEGYSDAQISIANYFVNSERGVQSDAVLIAVQMLKKGYSRLDLSKAFKKLNENKTDADDNDNDNEEDAYECR